MRRSEAGRSALPLAGAISRLALAAVGGAASWLCHRPLSRDGVCYGHVHVYGGGACVIVFPSFQYIRVWNLKKVRAPTASWSREIDPANQMADSLLTAKNSEVP